MLDLVKERDLLMIVEEGENEEGMIDAIEVIGERNRRRNSMNFCLKFVE
jgi:hypothetical protein